MPSTVPARRARIGRTTTPPLDRCGAIARRHVRWIILWALVLTAAMAAPVPAAEVVALRHWSGETHTRIVLDLSEPAAFDARVLTEPHRIAIDLRGSTIVPNVYAFRVGDGHVRRVRVNRLAGPLAQVVIDLEGPRRHAAFALREGAGKPERIVVDVFRPGPVAPRGDDTIHADDDQRRIVVLDPGHGGKEPGAVQNGIMEKTLTLRAARAIAEALEAADPEIEVHLTRDRDERLSLRSRFRKAEAVRADVFVSIHANAAPTGGARGSEVYFLTLGEATDTESRRIAELENAADLVDGAPPDNEGDLVSILADLQMKNTLARSSMVAEALLAQLAERRLLRTRAVKQAPFAVLQSARVPSVLLEMGFLSNRHDAKLMQSQSFLEGFAAAVAEGLVSYLARVETAG